MKYSLLMVILGISIQGYSLLLLAGGEGIEVGEGERTEEKQEREVQQGQKMGRGGSSLPGGSGEVVEPNKPPIITQEPAVQAVSVPVLSDQKAQVGQGSVETGIKVTESLEGILKNPDEESIRKITTESLEEFAAKNPQLAEERILKNADVFNLMTSDQQFSVFSGLKNAGYLDVSVDQVAGAAQNLAELFNGPSSPHLDPKTASRFENLAGFLGKAVRSLDASTLLNLSIRTINNLNAHFTSFLRSLSQFLTRDRTLFDNNNLWIHPAPSRRGEADALGIIADTLLTAMLNIPTFAVVAIIEISRYTLLGTVNGLLRTISEIDKTRMEAEPVFKELGISVAGSPDAIKSAAEEQLMRINQNYLSNISNFPYEYWEKTPQKQRTLDAMNSSAKIRYNKQGKALESLANRALAYQKRMADLINEQQAILNSPIKKQAT